MKLFFVIIITNFVIIFMKSYYLLTVYPCHIHTMIKFVVNSFNNYPAKLTQ